MTDAAKLVEVSHGRGGAGNIHPDDTQYVDGSVVRTGPEGSHGDGAYSVGRGGAGNIGDAGLKASTAGRADTDLVPSEAYRASTDIADHHTGRGGAGNEQRKAAAAAATTAPDETDAPAVTPATHHSHPVGLADKIKFKLFGKKQNRAGKNLATSSERHTGRGGASNTIKVGEKRKPGRFTRFTDEALFKLFGKRTGFRR